LKEQTRLSGSITNRGAARINAIGTPLGRYQKVLNDAIGSHWYMYVENQRDLISIGTARVTYTIDRSGKIKNLKVVENTSNEAFANVCLRSFLESKMPPMPDDVADTLPPEGLSGEMSFIYFAN
jgi:outer membrane biosynthesis protein TonB